MFSEIDPSRPHILSIACLGLVEINHGTITILAVSLHSHFPSNTFSLPNTPVAQDTSSHTHAPSIEAYLGEPDHMAASVGIAANAFMISAPLLRAQETWPQEVWARTGRVQLSSAFLASLVAGKWTSMGESEACATGAWVHGTSHNAAGHWDEDVLDIVGGNKEEGRRVRGWLGDVDVSGGSRRAGSVERYGFDSGGFQCFILLFPS